ncbi:MAG TPA: biopolymer transporter ExbD [Thermoanaerobaculia bacterium]|nr:biopolymer transporter ExbD [Thermoanaerobaculia bacterium]
MHLKARKQTAAVIPTASMADIVFLLIIFFVLTFNVEVDKTRVSLPRSVLRTEVPKKAAIVSITEVGQMRVSDGESSSTAVSSTEDVLSFATGVIAGNPEKEFVLKADATVPYKTVDRVIDVLKQARVPVVYLLSDQETVDTAGGN